MSVSLAGIGLVRDDEIWLEDINLELKEGRLTHALGPQRAGKTSLVRVLAGLLRPSTGRVRGVRPREVTLIEAGALHRDPRFLRRRLDAAVQRPARGGRPDPAEVLDALGLGPAAGAAAPAPATALRLDLALAIVTAPPVLLLDEPWGTLPAIAARQLREAVRPFLSARSGITVVTAGSAEAALSFEGDVAVMSAGRVVQEGLFAAVAASPQLVRATSCSLPRLNLAEATIRDGVLTLASRTVVKAEGVLTELDAGRYTLGVAADRLALAPFAGAMEFPGTVAVIEVDGGLRRLVAEVGQGVWHLVAPGPLPQEPGEHVTFYVDPQDVVVFGDTGVLEWRAGEARAKMGRG